MNNGQYNGTHRMFNVRWTYRGQKRAYRTYAWTATEAQAHVSKMLDPECVITSVREVKPKKV